MENYKSLDKYFKRFGDIFKLYGLSRDGIVIKYEKYLALNSNCSVSDFIWSVFQELLLIASTKAKTEQELYKAQWKLYSEMLEFRRKYEKSKANEILQLKLKANILMSYSQSIFKQKCEVISGHCCEFCDNLDGRRFEINDVLENQYLGSEKCTNEHGCNCCYAVVPERDSSGNLVLNE